MAPDLSKPAEFERAYAEHHRRVYATAFRVLGDAAQAQDVAQDVFLRLWRDPSRFDARRGELGPYLRLMARSRAIDLLRESQAAGRATDRLRVVSEREQARPEEVPLEAVSRAEDRAEVKAALVALPPAQREAIALAYWGGFTADEISQRIGVPLGTAKSRLRLGLGRLRSELAAA
ncbi:MAG TPA: sigma-70 family RNA polymerase sigma factor [Solirubrobacteraceae bacterium]